VRHLTGAGPTGHVGRERGWAPPRGEEQQSWMWSGHAPVGGDSGLSEWLGRRREPGKVHQSWSQPELG